MLSWSVYTYTTGQSSPNLLEHMASHCWLTSIFFKGFRSPRFFSRMNMEHGGVALDHWKKPVSECQLLKTSYCHEPDRYLWTIINHSGWLKVNDLVSRWNMSLGSAQISWAEGPIPADISYAFPRWESAVARWLSMSSAPASIYIINHDQQVQVW